MTFTFFEYLHKIADQGYQHRRWTDHYNIVLFIFYYFPNNRFDLSKYYSVLNDFFSKVEQKYSLEVIIAAHPKADYNTDVFGGRKILKYQTAKLVMHSQLVIAHSSLSISFSVLNYKPLVLVYLTDFYKMGTSTMVLIKKMSKELGSISICLDKDYTLEDLKIPDFVKYDNYKYNYLTSHKSECLENADIIYSVVNDL